MGNVFEIDSPLNEKIICSHDTWYGHIIRGHSIMQSNLPAVIDTLRSPDEIYKSSSTSDRKVYFKQSNLSSYQMYTKVVTKSIGDNQSEVVSAWPQRNIGGGISDKIYPNIFDYDSANDILYYSYGNTDNSYGDEDVDNIILMKDIDTEEITGITVLDFIRMYQEQDDRINIVSKYVDLPVVLKAII